MLSSSSMKHHISNKALFKNFLFNYINFYDVCKDYLNLSEMNQHGVCRTFS